MDDIDSSKNENTNNSEIKQNKDKNSVGKGYPIEQSLSKSNKNEKYFSNISPDENHDV